MKVGIFGAGAWGTALASQVAQFSKLNSVFLWARDPAQIADMQVALENKRYLPGIFLPPTLSLEADFKKAAGDLSNGDIAVIATPMSGLAETLSGVMANAHKALHFVCLCKGIEPLTYALAHEVFVRELAIHSKGIPHRFGVLAGPSFAREVGEGLPCALTIASENQALCDVVQEVFHHGNLRVYASEDLIGVEIGGAVKNILAIAAGIGDGLGLGLNARAALLTRGLAEMTRLVKSAGGKVETCTGLTGLGDLILTATGDLSRNRRVGLALAAGESLTSVTQHLGHVAEGVLCAQAVEGLAKQYQIEMPITSMVCRVLTGKLSPQEALHQLMRRNPKQE
ncbi:MAG: NAD(P)-dependent glycerol-3-phosphate dehydrogenase [Polynucleobacter sp.]|jgi:glycerol-3-phosphate dehydrogenase (NAD(P)+)|nr:NAD(P)-dependent glycerol-3-phosphate dehydrogenase [Polynucleobacter sp.]